MHFYIWQMYKGKESTNNYNNQRVVIKYDLTKVGKRGMDWIDLAEHKNR
jgi:hypothetical protein